MREQVLNNFKDVVLSLRSIHIKDPKFYQIWREKRDKLMGQVKELRPEDKIWLERKYSKWHRETILPLKKKA